MTGRMQSVNESIAKCCVRKCNATKTWTPDDIHNDVPPNWGALWISFDDVYLIQLCPTHARSSLLKMDIEI